MNKTDFKKTIWNVLNKYGFEKHGCNFYYDFGNDIIFVCSLQKGYTDYCYIDCGFCFKSINKNIEPYPRAVFSNFRCLRFRYIDNHKEDDMFYYNKFTENELSSIIEENIIEHLENGKAGKEKIIEYYINTDEDRCLDNIVTKSTAEYLNITNPKFTILNWG